MKTRTYSQTPLFLILFLCLFTVTQTFAQGERGQWDGIEGTRIANLQGETLGYVSDVVLDLENGRYLGVLVPVGGFLGIGARQQIIPPTVLTSNGTRNTLFLDMSKERFRNAPTFKMSQEVGPPQTAQVAAVYHYYGVAPYFNTGTPSSARANAKPGRDFLGYIKRGSRILYMNVENLQGKVVGSVFGFRDLDRDAGTIGGIVISPAGYGFTEKKIVPPQALRYNLKHNRLQLNNHEQPFKDSPDFVLTGAGTFYEEPHESRPGTFEAPLVQGTNWRDKRITKKIKEAILRNGDLSHYAQNIQIGTVKGKTTLRGRLTSQAEKNAIVAEAVKIAGRGNVTTIFTVSPMTRAEKKIDSQL